jgi:sulfopyruvate decarboxylase TPP-binding subunit
MAIDKMAHEDFDRARWKAFWRKVTTLLTGRSNELLPFDEVRGRLPMKGQHYIGLQQVPIDNIIGSLGRYRDFDRAFLPVQTRTRDRWVNIDKAHYHQLTLPAVDLFKMGEIYFVKDGNHRVSVARERGQEYIDAYVIEIEIPISLTADTVVDDLVAKQEYALFMEQTGLASLRLDATLETNLTGLYKRLLEHIDTHRWYLGEQRGADVPYTEAVTSWYDLVYMPVISTLRQNNVMKSLPGVPEVDLYLWVMDYQWYLREVYQDDQPEEEAKDLVSRQLVRNYPLPELKKLLKVMRNAGWFDELVLEQEWVAFEARTHLSEIRPGACVRTSIPGQYKIFLEHIAVHRWYLGEQREEDVPYAEAVSSWYDHVYLPLAGYIQEHGILAAFPSRTEADLYLWIIRHQNYLRGIFGEKVPVEQAAEKLVSDFGSASTGKKDSPDNE